MGTTDQCVGNIGRGCPDLRKDPYGSVPVSIDVWVGEVGDYTAHWEVLGRIPPQGGLQADGTETVEENRW